MMGSECPRVRVWHRPLDRAAWAGWLAWILTLGRRGALPYHWLVDCGGCDGGTGRTNQPLPRKRSPLPLA
jgi:hypothetical protein